MCVISVNPLLILKIKILPEIQEFLCCLVIKSAYNLMCPFQEVCSRFAQILFIRSHSSILPASHKKCFHRIWWPMTSHQEATADSYLSKLPDKQRGGTFMSHLPSLGLSLPMFSSFFPPDGHSGGIRKMLHLERQVRRWKRKRKLCFCDCCFPLGIAKAAFISSRWHFRRTRPGPLPRPPSGDPGGGRDLDISSYPNHLISAYQMLWQTRRTKSRLPPYSIKWRLPRSAPLTFS